MDKYNAQENIKHLTELLGEKLDPTKREMVVRLLSIEKTKLQAILELEEIRSKRSEYPRPIAAWLIELASGGAIRRAFRGGPSANLRRQNHAVGHLPPHPPTRVSVADGSSVTSQVVS